MLVGSDDDQGGGREWGVFSVEVNEGSSNAGIGEIVELSINSMVGLSSPKTMKVKGTIAQQHVVVVIDCGATNNFIWYSSWVFRWWSPIIMAF